MSTYSCRQIQYLCGAARVHNLVMGRECYIHIRFMGSFCAKKKPFCTLPAIHWHHNGNTVPIIRVVLQQIDTKY